jgi:hypothetical protein
MNLAIRVRILTGAVLLLLPVAILWGQNQGDAPSQAPAAAKGKGKGKGAPKQPSRPTPRWPDGHPMLSAPPGEIGYWNSGTGGLTGKNGNNLPTNLEIDEVPFQPWARALFDERRRTQSKDDPHVRCVAPGGPRQFHTPFGLLIYELPEAKRVLVLSGGGPRTWRVIYTDGRPHPTSDDFNPTFLGHSVGKWEGDVLVVDSVGYNEKFWFARAGYPHTEALHLVERISRPDFNTLKYEVTVEDPRTYTRPWTGGHYITWVPNQDFEEYFCQENNRDIDHMVGQ